MDRIENWRQAQLDPRQQQQQYRVTPPVARPKPPIIDLSASSDGASSPSAASNASSDLIIVRDRPAPAPIVKPTAPAFREHSNLFINRPHHQQQQQQARPPPALVPHHYQRPLQPVQPVAPAPAFASSSKAFNVAPQVQKTLKQRIAEEMEQKQKQLGVPFAVPQNAPFRAPVVAPRPVKPTGGDDEDFLNLDGAVPDMDFQDGLDEEAALKELIASTMDLDNVDMNAASPDGLLVNLLPHQVQGLHWLKDREKGKKRGGILADDMGLGKTIQMLALMLANPSSGNVIKLSDGKRCKTTLIICPVALMEQWKSEIETKSDAELRVTIHHGAGKKTARQLAKYDVVITSYNTAAAEWVDPKPRKKKGKGKEDDDEGDAEDPKDKGALFGVEKYYRIILDEAHNIKGRSTKSHKACCDLVGHYRWCLTGTPIHNTILDLFALFEFLGKIVNPLHQYSEFKEKIETPLKNKRTKIAMSRLAVVLKAVMLRRIKTMTVDGKPLLLLPKREIIEVKGPFLDAEEEAFYKAVELKMSLTMNAFIKTGTMMQNYTHVLILLLRMRQACSHPSLVTGASTSDDAEGLDPTPATGAEPSSSKALAVDEDDDLASLLGGLSVSTALCTLCSQPGCKKGQPICDKCVGDFARYGSLTFSTKVRKIMKVLQDIKDEGKGRKTILFSQFTSFFNILEPFLVSGGFKFIRYDGKMNQKQKEAALSKIRDDPKTTVLLLSLKCGAVGLNLTCCSRIILADTWWNMAVENQAIDRAHRFGQTENVKVYKVSIDNTIEDRVLQLQKEKSELAKAALDGGDMTKANKLSMKDILYLFRGAGKDDDE